jgi:ABC-type Na+ transport system ATPase subunit NatA
MRSFFDDSDVIKYDEPNSSVDIFTNRIYKKDDFLPKFNTDI